MKKRAFGILTPIIEAASHLVGIVAVVFALFYLAPGNPARVIAGKHASEVQVKLIANELGLNQPVWKRFVNFLNDLSPVSVTAKNAMPKGWSTLGRISIGESHLVIKWPYLGKSFHNGRSVNSLIAEALPETFVLAFASLLIASLLGIPLGVVSAQSPGGVVDRLVMVLSSAGMAIPVFLAGIVMGWIFGYLLSDFTGLSMTGNLFTYDVYQGREVFTPKNLILPAFTLAIRPMGVVSQLTSATMREVLRQNYIRTARAKGLSETTVVVKHALKNALSPVVSVVALWFVALMSGSVFIEYVFGWSGLGALILQGIEFNDLPLIMGVTLLASLVFIAVQTLLKYLNPLFDPRTGLS
ncbi:MAG: ABC transporter permease [Salibacteraceae bacterium]